METNFRGFDAINTQKVLTEMNRRMMYATQTIQKSEENDIEKGGEGSRGGKVIGHTKSGKPIYDTTVKHNVIGYEGTHADFSDNHKHFTAEDHKDAAEIHNKQFEHHGNEWQRHYDSVSGDDWNNENSKKGKIAVEGTKEAAKQQEKHAKLVKWHKEAAKQKETK